MEIKKLYQQRQELNNQLQTVENLVKLLPHLDNGLLTNKAQQENKDLLKKLDIVCNQIKAFNQSLSKQQKIDLIKYKRNLKKG